jgi:ribonuclease HII
MTDPAPSSIAFPFDARSDLVAGIDEAGRGPILGPLVMAIVVLRPTKAASLTRAGVTDSKRFGAGEDGHAARAALLPRILDAATHVEVSVIDVAEVDRYTRRGGLNRLEQERARALICRAPAAKRVVADGARLFGPLRHMHPRFDALDRAEEQHATVAAASIIAKVRRDEIFARIAARYRDEFGALAGGGYVNAGSREFLRAYITRYGAPPPEARRSWPWDFAADLLGPKFDRWADVPDDRPQLALAL